ncbi:MAG: MarR family transcriptional regulator [Veillonella sp.]|nr:MarR family transcriptional regulator [Veillonella sp.]MCF0156202.1 MarR family transcriptional regulator [Veillonella sp.]
MKGILQQLSPDEMLQLDNQICFPLYATSKSMVAAYRPFLDRIGLTYTQYLVMMVLWSHPKGLTVRALGDKLYLDSGTLTPLLKKLDAKGFIVRDRDYLDERVVIIRASSAGMSLKEDAYKVPVAMIKGINNFTLAEVADLKRLLGKLHISLQDFQFEEE